MTDAASAALGRRPRVAVLAAVVQDLVGGQDLWVRTEEGLRQRVEAAGLDRHEGSALEALRARLGAGRDLLSTDTGTSWM